MAKAKPINDGVYCKVAVFIEWSTMNYVEGDLDFQEAFAETNPPFSWGDNNRSLVNPHDLAFHIKETMVGKTANAIVKRLKALPIGVFVDLEN